MIGCDLKRDEFAQLLVDRKFFGAIDRHPELFAQNPDHFLLPHDSLADQELSQLHSRRSGPCDRLLEFFLAQRSRMNEHFSNFLSPVHGVETEVLRSSGWLFGKMCGVMKITVLFRIDLWFVFRKRPPRRGMSFKNGIPSS